MQAESFWPYNIEAEQAILGSIMIDPVGLSKLIRELDEDCFYNADHKAIIKAIKAVERPDPITVANKLPTDFNRPYLHTLISGVTTSLSAGYYADILRDKKARRDILTLAHKLAEQAKAEDGMQTAKQLVSDFRFPAERKKLKGMNMLGEDHMTFIENSSMRQVLTGYTQIDKDTRGINQGEVMILAARSGVGKTTLALNIIRNVSQRQRTLSTIFASLEMGSAQIYERLAAITLEKSPRMIEEMSRAKDDELKSLVHQYPFLKVFDSDSATLQELEAQVENENCSLLIIDYLGYLKAPAMKSKYEETSYIARELKALAKRQEIAIICLCQVSRMEGKGGGSALTIAAMRDSGVIEESADYILGAWRPSLEPNNGSPDHELYMGLLKNRCGPLGTYKCHFDKETLRISEE